VPQLIVALGPGEPELVPAASLDALREAGGCTLAGAAASLADDLAARGVAVVPDAPVLAALDADAAALARRDPAARTVPARRVLARQGASAAAGALLELTARLRAECPWDRAQTAPSIVPHTVEEAYEVADAVALAGLSAKLIDELGDLLFQTTFLALLCEEQGVGDWGDVAAGVSAKLRRRHPWVFGDEAAASAGDARARWEDVKREQEDRQGIFHDIPEALPGLLLARKLQRRAAAVGFDHPTLEAALADLESELRELAVEVARTGEPAAEHQGDPGVAHELGDILFAAANVARRLSCDPELAVRAAAARFRGRVEGAERLAAAEGIDFVAADSATKEGYYQAAKRSQSHAERGTSG
jgi:MazG family protein